MRIGASTGCFYPLETEKSLIKLGELGVKVAEIFPNSPSELSEPYLKNINQIKDSYGMDIVSFHPYMSFSEGFFIFSEYERRFIDSLEMYKPFFNAAANIGAKYYVLHGAKKPCHLPKYVYLQRYAKFCEVAKTFGVQVAHENVVLYQGQSVGFMQYLQSQLGSDFKMVLDTKQARRTKLDAFEFVEKLGENIAHVHVSDYTKTSVCSPLSRDGLFDFQRLFTELKQKGYEGKYILELYNKNFESDKQISSSIEKLNSILSEI